MTIVLMSTFLRPPVTKTRLGGHRGLKRIAPDKVPGVILARRRDIEAELASKRNDEPAPAKVGASPGSGDRRRELPNPGPVPTPSAP